jgi:hypothetical protein
MHRLHRAAALLALCALTGCTTNQPLCRYWSDAPIGKELDPSAVPMLPYNPYWVGPSAAKTGSSAPQDVCAGEPGHPAEAVH